VIALLVLLLFERRARRHSNPGIDGNAGNVESATYRIYRILSGSNPTLSANLRQTLASLAASVGTPRQVTVIEDCPP
jgi:hypothetical protein